MSRNVSNYKLKKATEHLYYEIEGFYNTALVLKSKKFILKQFDLNILLNSFAIHTRNLFDFFYPKNNNIKEDDMLVYDYISNYRLFNVKKTNKKELNFIVKKVNKQVVHLTYKRNRYSVKTNKGWDPADVMPGMTKTIIAFYNLLPNSYKNWPYIKLIKEIIDKV